MVNSKKMRKSTVAIVLLSLLLCLSMILTATGAWFTSFDKNEADSTTITFGKVDVSIEGKAVYTKTHEGAKVVDGCSWTINGLSFMNNSDVDVYYAYNVTVKLLDSSDNEVKGDVASYFTITDAQENDGALLKTTDTIATINNMKVTFDSKGVMNGKTDTYKLQIIVKVAAVQADHNDLNQAKTQLAALLAGNYTQTAIVFE